MTSHDYGELLPCPVRHAELHVPPNIGDHVHAQQGAVECHGFGQVGVTMSGKRARV